MLFPSFRNTDSILVQIDKCFTLKKNRKMINECHNNAFSFKYSQNKQFFLKKKVIWRKELQCILSNLKWVAILSLIFYLSNIVEQKSLYVSKFLISFSAHFTLYRRKKHKPRVLLWKMKRKQQGSFTLFCYILAGSYFVAFNIFKNNIE